MIEPQTLEQKIAELLDVFYKRRIEKIETLQLKDALLRKNPYLFRAVGVQRANEIVEGLLSAYMSSSDEGIFGDAFFEPLAKFVSGGTVSPSEGVDVALVDDKFYKAIAVKSGPSVFNAQSKRRQADDFKTLQRRMLKIGKSFDPIVGYAYGRKQQSNRGKASFRELAGQVFWEEITGDPDFYLKIIYLMKEKPQKHLAVYRGAWDAAVNRFTRDFINEFCLDNGMIDWGKLVQFNSGRQVKSLNVDPQPKTVSPGDSYKLSVTANYKDGSVKEVRGDMVTYLTSNEDIVNIDSVGFVMVNSNAPDGATAEITVYYMKSKKSKIKVKK